MKPNFKLQETKVVSNHFKIQLPQPRLGFLEWHMSFIRQTDLPRFTSDPNSVRPDALADDARGLISAVLAANKHGLQDRLGRHFSSGLTLYSTTKTQFSNAYFDSHSEFVLIIEKKNEVADFAALAANHSARFPLMRFLNSALKSAFGKLDFVELGYHKKYYNSKLSELVTSGDHRFVVLKGYKTAFELYEGGLRLLVDHNTRIIREKSLWREVLDYRAAGLSDADIIENFIKGKSVMTAYGSQRIMRVDEVLTAGRPKDPFPNPQFSSYADYFTRRFCLQLQFPDQFLLVHNKKVVERDASGQQTSVRVEKVVLLPELVRATGLTDEMRADFRIMKDLGTHTILAPQERMNCVTKLIGELNGLSSANLDFKIQTGSNQTTGYKLKPPSIISGPKSSQVPSNDRIALNSLVESHPLTNWVFVFDPACEKHIDTILDNFEKAASKFKVKFDDPGEFIKLERKTRAADVEAAIRQSERTPKPDLVFFFVSRRAASAAYKEMKRHFNSVGIPTQFFVSFNPHKDVSSISKYSTLLMQMINKMGCNLWYVDRSLKGSLVLGADVYHARGNRSVASVVSQFDDYFKRSYSTARVQPREYQELVRSMSHMVLEHVENYVSVFKQPPKDLVFFRDGVGEGMVDEVLNTEVRAIENQLAEKYGAQKPGLLFVVVTKRVDDRFAVDSQGLRNPEGGLLVIKDVVKPDRANFFLVAQKVTQGTANPTHYDVVYNNTAIGLNDLVSLAYELTWGYSNWLGPVKVPAPVQFAHKLCSLIGLTQDHNVAKNLKSVRFYM